MGQATFMATGKANEDRAVNLDEWVDIISPDPDGILGEDFIAHASRPTSSRETIAHLGDVVLVTDWGWQGVIIGMTEDYCVVQTQGGETHRAGWYDICLIYVRPNISQIGMVLGEQGEATAARPEMRATADVLRAEMLANATDERRETVEAMR